MDNLPLFKGTETDDFPPSINQETVEWALQKTYEFAQLMSCYRCAMMQIETKFNILNEEFSLRFDHQPNESTIIQKGLAEIKRRSGIRENGTSLL